MQKTIFLLIAFSSLAFSQSKIDMNQGEIMQKNYCDTIPFEYVNNKILVNVSINNETKKFIFDTGACQIISDEVQQKMKNPELAISPIYDSNNKKSNQLIVNIKEFKLGHLTFQNIPSAVIDYKNLGVLNCFKIDGLIGSNVLRNSIVKIDTKQKIIIITDRIENLKLKNYYSDEIKLDKQSSPFIKINLDNQVSFDALFDSGSDDFLSISRTDSEKIVKKNGAIKLNVGFGSNSIGINGFDDEKKLTRISVKNLTFGKSTISNFTAISSKTSENVIGMKMSDYGHFTIDYVNKKYYFEGFEEYQNFNLSKTIGFTLMPAENQYNIGIVWSNTQAEKMGLKTGLKILKINDFDLSIRNETTDCSLFFAKLLKSETVKITFIDNEGISKTVNLTQE